MSPSALLYRALEAKFGIVVKTPDPAFARLQLYEERKQLGDARLDQLSFAPRKPNLLYIYKRGARNAAP